MSADDDRPRRLTWSQIGRALTPDRVLVVVLCAVASAAVVMLAVNLGVGVHPALGWLVVALGFGGPGAALASRMHRESRLDRERDAVRATREHSRVEEALGPHAPAATSARDDDEPARAPRPGWRT